MRIAFFGGTFDPPHSGHLAIAQAAVERLELDQVWMAPAGLQPLKQGVQHAPFSDRLAMVRIACSGQARMAATAMDAPRVDGRPNYSFDTLSKVRATLIPGDELFLLIGADAFELLPKWHRAGELLSLCTLVIAGRPGSSLEALCAGLPPGVSGTEVKRQPALVEYALHGGEANGRPMYVLPDLQYDVSATGLRGALAAGNQGALAGLVDGRVAEYARAHGLYA